MLPYINGKSEQPLELPNAKKGLQFGEFTLFEPKIPKVSSCLLKN